MNLWIRSQDKEKLVLATGVELHGSCYDDSCQIFAIWQNNKQFIGVYVSKEKALEVLDEIQKFLENINKRRVKMKVDYKSIFKLKTMLDDANIFYEFLDRSIVIDNMIKYPFYQIIVYVPYTEDLEEPERLISVIQGYGTFGSQSDLLEIQGCMSKDELADDVLGYLTAEDVFKRIRENYHNS